MYVVGYFMFLALYYGAIKPNLDTVPEKKHLTPKSEYSSPLPLPTPKNK